MKFDDEEEALVLSTHSISQEEADNQKRISIELLQVLVIFPDRPSEILSD